MLKQWAPRSAILLALALGAVSIAAISGTQESPGSYVVAWAHEAGTPKDAPIRTERFKTLREAAAVATGGRVELADAATIDDLVAALEALDLSDQQVAMASSTTIGIDYADSWYSGAVYLWAVPNSVGCSTGLSYHVNTMPSGWNNRVSSAIAAGGCGSYIHYSGVYQTGSSINCTCPSMGWMDNRTRSERWVQ